MSAPERRLLGDEAAERFRMDALVLLGSALLVPPAIEGLAAAVVALTDDRQARIELATVANQRAE